MKRWTLRSALAAALLAFAGLGSAGLGGVAFADPAIESVGRKVVKSRRLDVTVTASTARGGTVILDGIVSANGVDRHVRLRKKVKPGTRDVVLKIDPKRFKVRRVDGPLVFDFGISVSERGSQTRAENTFRHVVPCPLILLPGFGNETTPASLDLFATSLDATAGGIYGFNEEKPAAHVIPYDSTNDTLAVSARNVDTQVKAILKGSIFTKVDVVAYSMGGLVARRWVAERGPQSGRGKVRKMIFLCTPNEGAPLAYIANTAAASGTLGTLLGDSAGLPIDLTPFVDALATPEAQNALRNFYPSYGWVQVTLPFIGTTTLPPGSPFLPDSVSPLTELNANDPDPACDYHAVFYSSVITQQVGVEIGTVDKVDATSLLAIGGQGGSVDFSQIDLAAFASGEGDGVVPAHSVRMDDVPVWKNAITDHDLGAGFHLTATIDPMATTLIALILASPSN